MKVHHFCEHPLYEIPLYLIIFKAKYKVKAIIDDKNIKQI